MALVPLVLLKLIEIWGFRSYKIDYSIYLYELSFAVKLQAADQLGFRRESEGPIAGDSHLSRYRNRATRVASPLAFNVRARVLKEFQKGLTFSLCGIVSAFVFEFR